MNTDFPDVLHDKEAECAVLGAMMTEPDAKSVIPKVVNVLGTDANVFFTTDHQFIYSAILDVFHTCETANPILVADHLQKSENLNRVGGSDYLYQLQAPIVETESAEFYAKILIEKYQRRQLISTASQIGNRARDENIPIADIQSYLLETAGQMQTITANFKEKYGVVSLQELWDRQFPEIQWVVPNIIPEGFTVIAGKSGFGKSFFSLEIAISASIAGVPLSYPSLKIEKARNVLYLLLEDKDRTTQSRMHDLMSNIPPDGNFDFLTEKKDLLLDPNGLSVLENAITEHGYDLIIVDPLETVKPTARKKGRGTAYEQDYEVMAPIRRFCHELGVSILLTTHRTKAETSDPFQSIQGSAAMQATADTTIIMQKTESGPTMTIRTRETPEVTYAMTQLENGFWKLEGVADKVYKSEARMEIIQLLHDAGEDGMQRKEILDSTENKGAATLLRRMVADGDICQPRERGSYYHPEFTPKERTMSEVLTEPEEDTAESRVKF